MKVPFIDLNRQHAAIKDELDEAIQRVMSSGNFILGEEVAAFEEEFASYTGAKHCVTCANGTDALELAFEALEILPGDEVILPAFGWVSASMALKRMGAIPVYVDIHPGTFHIMVEEIEPAITSRTKAVVIVHLFGQANEVYEVSRLCKDKGLWLIEDCAQAHGLFIDGKQHVGNFGDIGTFSFYPTKNLGCIGDGGGIITNNSELADKIRALRDYGRVVGKFTIDGRNSRMDELQAAVLRTKLPHLDNWNERRREVARKYDEVRRVFDNYTNCVYYKYPILIDSSTQVSDPLLRLETHYYILGDEITFDHNLRFAPIFPEMHNDEIHLITTVLSTLSL
ncbi:MAG: DegT/DnrJ/EryC1/StrS family aminotransferase [Cyclobacteriaceae bacterium]